MQPAHVARRVLEVGKWLALGRALPVAVSLHPREGARAVPAVTGRYVPVTEHHRLVWFDLPWHGKSPPPEGAIHGPWRLNTDLYVASVTYQIYSESAGSGQDVPCMHTAGAGGRQFHGLMADPRGKAWTLPVRGEPQTIRRVFAAHPVRSKRLNA